MFRTAAPRFAAVGIAGGLIALATYSCLGAGGDATTNPEDAGPDFAIQGEYLGTVKSDEGEAPIGAQIIALGDGKFHGVFFPGGLPGEGYEGRFRLQTEMDIYPGYGPAPEGWERGPETIHAEGERVDGLVTLRNEHGSADIVDGTITIKHTGGTAFGTLKKVVRESSTLGAAPPDGATVLFDGSTAETFENGRTTEDGLLVAGCLSKQSFRDFTLHLEFRTPFMPASREQGRGNSGMYLQNRYETQVLDSFGLEGRDNECGGVYSVEPPRLNMCFPPLSWQTYDVDFTAARFDDSGNKTKNAVLTLRHNGVAIYENLELPSLTPGGASEEFPGEGPLQLQDHGNPVHYRNIWVLAK